MEATNNTTATAATVETAAPIRKGRVPKLVRTETSFRPGAVVAKVVSSADVYAIYFAIPNNGGIGTKEESAEVYDFSVELDERAKTANVGAVEKISANDSSFEVMLKLDQPVGAVDPEALVSNAFRSLADFMKGAAILNNTSIRLRAAWKYKLNGSVLDEGDF